MLKGEKNVALKREPMKFQAKDDAKSETKLTHKPNSRPCDGESDSSILLGNKCTPMNPSSTSKVNSDNSVSLPPGVPSQSTSISLIGSSQMNDSSNIDSVDSIAKTFTELGQSLSALTTSNPANLTFILEMMKTQALLTSVCNQSMPSDADVAPGLVGSGSENKMKSARK